MKYVIGGVIVVAAVVIILLGKLPKHEPEAMIIEQPEQTIPEPKSTITEVETSKKTTANNKRVQNGMTIEIIKEGNGPEITNNQTAVVHYTGKLTNGTVFDSSIPRGEAFSFVLGSGMVIQGWDKGVLGMKVGEKRLLTIPPELAYGDRGVDPVIPPKSTLVFEVELIAIK